MTTRELNDFLWELNHMDGLTEKAQEVIATTEYHLLPDLFEGMDADEINEFVEENYPDEE